MGAEQLISKALSNIENKLALKNIVIVVKYVCENRLFLVKTPIYDSLNT